MTTETWLDVCSRISSVEPVDLDHRIFRLDHEDFVEPGTVGFPGIERGSGAPSSVIWNFKRDDTICLGVRVSEPFENCVRAATRLVAIAVERGITPIILSSLPYSGFERFGFRVERLAGTTSEEMMACEEELKRIWRIAVVFDLSEIVGIS